MIIFALQLISLAVLAIGNKEDRLINDIREHGRRNVNHKRRRGDI